MVGSAPDARCVLPRLRLPRPAHVVDAHARLRGAHAHAHDVEAQPLWQDLPGQQRAPYAQGRPVGAHVVVMPLLGWAPNPFPWVAGAQTWSEHFSEFFGHIVWLWSIEIVRRDLRNRITHEPDAEVALDAEPAR